MSNQTQQEDMESLIPPPSISNNNVSNGSHADPSSVNGNGVSTAVQVEDNVDFSKWYVLVPTVAGWWGSSSMFSSYTKRCFHSDIFDDMSTLEGYTAWSSRFAAVVVTVWLSLFACTIFYLLTKWMTINKTERSMDKKDFYFHFRKMLSQAMLMKGPGGLQLCANVMTNSTVAMGTVTGATALKATEPFFVMTALFLIDPNKFKRQMGSEQIMYLTASVMGTLVAIGGAGALSLNAAFMFAMSANTLFAVRTVLIKGCQDSPQWTGDSKDLFGSCCLVGFVAASALLALSCVVFPVATWEHGLSLLQDGNVWISAVAYVGYNYLSFVVLGFTTSVVHSVFKSGKISAILTGATIINTEPVLVRVWIGLCINALSAVMMFLSTKKNIRIKKSSVVLNVTGLFFACFLGVFALEQYRTGGGNGNGPPAASFMRNSALTKSMGINTPLKLGMMRQQRHKCIQRIRRLQFDTLGDIVIKDHWSTWGHEVLLVDPAYHANVGDHMLTLGEIEFLRSLGWGKEAPRRFSECSVVQGRGHAWNCNFLKEPNKYADIKLAVYHAGGNWGNLWPHVHKGRLDSFLPLLKSGKTILGMPQSLHYDMDRYPKPETDTLAMREAIAEGLGMKDHIELDTDAGREYAKSRVILTWREQKSYDAAMNMYPFVSHLLMPDIAFQLGPYLPSLRPDLPVNIRGKGQATKQSVDHPIVHRVLPDKVDLLLFMRTDYESATASQEEMEKEGGKRSERYWRKYLDNLPGHRGRGITFKIVDWMDRYEFFQDNYDLTSQTSVDLMHLGRVVIADRLHASIMSFLSDVPFVYVDQRTKKISSTLGVAFSAWEGCQDQDALMYQAADDIEDGIDKALDMLYAYDLRSVYN